LVFILSKNELLDRTATVTKTSTLVWFALQKQKIDFQ